MPEDKEQNEALNVDPFLRDLVAAVNSEEITFAITLNVSGLLVSGVLTGGRTYFKEFAHQFENMFGGGDKNTEETIRNLGDEYKVYAADSDSPKPHPQYIHLRDTKFHSSGFGSAIPKEGVLWRGRLESVDGFVLGSLHEVNIVLSEFSTTS